MMELEFYLSTNGSDTNGGSSESVIVSGSGTADVTQGDATVDLSDGTPDLSSVNQGSTHDTIRIQGRTDGINGTDIFEIADVELEGQYTIEVSPTPSAAGSSDKDWCIGGPWATPQKGANVVDSGDTLWIKADGDYSDDSDSDGNCMKLLRDGGTTTPILIAGYKDTIGDADSHRGDDDYRAVIDGTVNGLTHCISEGAAGRTNTVLANLYLKSASGSGADFGDSSDMTFKNCRFSSNQIGCDASATASRFEQCVFDNNTIFGVNLSGVLVGCDVYDNGVGGVYVTGPTMVMFCQLYNNAGPYISASAVNGPHCIMNNTFDGYGVGGSTAILFSGTVSCVVANNIIYDCGVGIHSIAGNLGERVVSRNNVFSSNDADRTNFPTGVGDVSADDPKFVGEANNDYRLRYDSPARGAGWPGYLDIGAVQRRPIVTHRPTNLGVQT